ncbi:MAG TPA: hypothetical protein VFF98_05050 [Novosphingobium sp.]|nr:hypothetical protein [Novosphingobium sp.]HZV08309.1 hypothetical protein [Novosphingobium sp.]
MQKPLAPHLATARPRAIAMRAAAHAGQEALRLCIVYGCAAALALAGLRLF